MKKFIIAFAAIAAALTSASCNKEVATPEINPATGTKTVIKASTENTTTKTALDESYNVVWSVGDSFKAIGPVTFYTFNLANNDDAGKTSATFECFGQIEDDEYRAWYATEGDDCTIWPDVQTYEAGKITNSPMTAIFSVEDGEAGNIQFKNMGGLLRLTISGTAEIKSITISADQAMAGEFSCDEPGMAATIMDSKKSITLYCGDGVTLTNSGAEFFIAMPAGTYTGVSVKLTATDGKICTKTFKGTEGLVIEKSVITPASFTASTFVAPPFSVSATKKVYFSKGNLYWDGDSFEFETNQYDIATSWNTSHVSDFYWSNSASVAYVSSYSDGTAMTSDVLFTNKDETSPKDGFTVNGETGVWRALSQTEWQYLFANHSYKYVPVAGKSGIVIAPDGFTGTIEDSYDTSSWTEAEAAGFVFLPNTGFRQGTFISETDKSCIYWTSTAVPESADVEDQKEKAYRMFIQWNSPKLTTNFETDGYREWAAGIRLVKDCK